jgi:hypothetical protein
VSAAQAIVTPAVPPAAVVIAPPVQPRPAVVPTPAPQVAALPQTAAVTSAVPPTAPAIVPPQAPLPRALAGVQVPGTGAGDAVRYLARGRQHMSQGDIAAARLFFERAADDNSGAAALEMAMTFDPDVLADSARAVVGVVPDKVQARTWYQRADKLGVTGLAGRLQAMSRP